MGAAVGLYRDQGVVLRHWKLGEADRIVAVLTADHGKVRAVAKGARKPGSRLGSRLEPTSHVTLQLYRGRGDLDTVTQVESRGRLPALRGDLDRWTRASAMLEVVDQVAQERQADRALYEMLVRALATLATSDSSLVAAAFFLKLLALEGVGPVAEACAGCGAEGPLVSFSVGAGGALCPDCGQGSPVSPEALGLMAAVLGGRLGAALQVPPGPVTREVDALATRLVEHHLERRIRSIAILGQS